jgi:diazepam-binding inhibitor (GABA receptor modulating acyl-CoA-binding protein)
MIIYKMNDIKFNNAIYYVKNSNNNNSQNDIKLQYYKYYKQATCGDITDSQPWLINYEARAKWNAWNSIKGMDKNKAKEEYIKLLNKYDSNWINRPNNM